MKPKYFAILALFITAAVLAFNARATEPQVEVVPFPVGRYDYQDRAVACNLAMNTSLAVDGVERFLSNADYLNQRCGLRGVLAATSAGSRAWTGIAGSPDLSVITAAVHVGYIYTSTS